MKWGENPWKTKKSVQNVIKSFLLIVFGNPKVHLMGTKDIAKNAEVLTAQVIKRITLKKCSNMLKRTGTKTEKKC